MMQLCVFSVQIKEDFEDRTSPWPSLWLCNFVQFLCGVQFAIYFTSMWPFLTGLDPAADFGFLGIIVAVFSIGQTLASPLFGLWSQKAHNTKFPASFGLCLSALGHLLYALLPTIKSNAKWFMLLARILTGVGSGNLGVLRAYTATASVESDRSKAMALGIAAFVVGQSLGPALQAIFSPIGAKGVWLGVVHLSMYTVPAYVMILLSMISIILLLFCFEEKYSGIIDIDEEKGEQTYRFNDI
uniref:Major facilitator superfamily (MFS) profile domain-containing protein n=1 Tax=Parascaris univalens TaxID=6257 RepID=A0A914ZQT8_PARUN